MRIGTMAQRAMSVAIFGSLAVIKGCAANPGGTDLRSWTDSVQFMAGQKYRCVGVGMAETDDAHSLGLISGIAQSVAREDFMRRCLRLNEEVIIKTKENDVYRTAYHPEIDQIEICKLVPSDKVRYEGKFYSLAIACIPPDDQKRP